MSGRVRTVFGLNIPHGKLAECIAELEEGLRALRTTPYHAVLGRDYLPLAQPAADYIVDFFRESRDRGAARALYFEMNGFAINPDRWYFEGFAYKTGGTLWDLTWNQEWLSSWDHATDGDFTLTGLEDVQAAFASLYRGGQPLSVDLAGEITQHLVVARFDQLIEAAHAIAKKKCPDLAGVPVLCTAHDWDVLYPME